MSSVHHEGRESLLQGVPGNQQVFLHIHFVACSAVGKFMVTASCNFKAPRSAPPKQILE